MTAAVSMTELWDADEREAWQPPPDLKPSQWAEAYRSLPRGQSAIEGPWRNENAPHLRGIMDLAVSPGIVQLNVQKPAQYGASEALRNVLAYKADCEPDPAGLALPDREKGRQIVENRILPLFRMTPRLQRILPDRAHELKKGQVHLRNGFTLSLMWSGSPSSTASDPMQFVNCDEVNKFRQWSGVEADAVTLTEKRLRTFGDRRCQVNTLTPTHRYGRITQLMEGSDVQLDFQLPCPLCGAFQRMVFGRLKWKKPPKAKVKDKVAAAALVLRTPGAVWYECEACGKRIDESDKMKMARTGRWSSRDGSIPDAEAVACWPAGTRLGMQGDPFGLLWFSWADIAAEFIRAEGDLAKTMDFYCQTLGMPFETQVARTDADFFSEKSRRATLPEGVLPRWAARVLATIDTQHDHFWAVVRAWGPEMRSQRVWHGRLESFDDLDRLCFQTPWPFEADATTGQPLYAPLLVDLALIDSGGTRLEGERASRTMQVYTWALLRQARVRAIKGASQSRPGMFVWRGKGWLDDELTRKNPGAAARHIDLTYLDTGHWADVMADMASQGTRSEDKRPEIWHLNQRDDAEYNHHLAGVAKVITGRGSQMKEEWKPKQDGARIDLWDCEVYQAAAAWLAQVQLLPPLEIYEQFRLEQAQSAARAQQNPAKPRERRDPWRPTPFGR